MRPGRLFNNRHRGSKRRRAGVHRLGGPSGCLVAGQESTAGAYPDDGRDRPAPVVHVFAKHSPVRRIRSARPAAGVARNLRGLSYAVTQRTNEIGVRMALGATSRDILLSFGQRGLALTITGLAIGLAL